MLRDVKLLRYVSKRYLPSLASIAKETIYQPGDVVVRQGDPTDSTLYIVADGQVRKLHVLPENFIYKPFSSTF